MQRRRIEGSGKESAEEKDRRGKESGEKDRREREGEWGGEG